MSPLTAGHFLIGRPLKSIPTTITEDQPLPLCRHWKIVEHLQQQIWRSWRAAYFQSMNTFSKWRQSHPNLKEGDVVILRDETLVRCSWLLGLIVKTYPGSDGRVRVADVRHLSLTDHTNRLPLCKRRWHSISSRPGGCPGLSIMTWRNNFEPN